MIPNTKDRELTSSVIAASGKFGISTKDSVHLMTILRDTLYSDKELAVLREYSANAWDAHREVKKDDLPIKVTIPTSMAPSLTIRDYGPGLSQADVFQVYTQYGASTKRDSDNAVGMLGIGSKSGFAYSDSFTITSWHGGMKRIYIAVLDKSEEGVINMLHEEACGPDETGIEIQIAVKPQHVLTFHNKATRLFEYFNPRPDINIDLPPEPTAQTRLKHGTMIESRQGEDGNHEWVAVMGCVPYRINLDQVRSYNNGGQGIAEYITRISGALYFKIGEVQISASREELKYSDLTKVALIEKFSLLVDEFVEHTLANIEKGGFSYWERRVRAQVLTALHLPIPKDCKSIIEDYVKLKGTPKLSTITNQHGTATVGISVTSRARMLLRDDDRALAHYQLSTGDYVVTKNDKATWDDAKQDLEEYLKKNELDGMPTVNISSCPWYPPAPKPVKPPKLSNKKHAVTTFKLIKENGFYSPYSDIWEIVKRVPEKDDVFILLNKFKGDGFKFFELYEYDKRLAKLFGLTMPGVYGYKTTKKVPIDPKDCVGTEYREWREAFARSIFNNKKTAKVYNYWEWAKGADNGFNQSPNKKHHATISTALGARHPITKFFKKQQDGKRVTKKVKYEMESALRDLRGRFHTDGMVSEHQAAIKEIYKKYPLIEAYGLAEIWQDNSDKWIGYIKLIDQG